MSFHDVRFPPEISYGSKGGPKFNTTVLELGSGFEKRNINWADARAEYDVAHGVKSRHEMDQLQAFFRARFGKAYSFRFKDWADYYLGEQVIGTGNGTTKTFQINKRYENIEPISGTAYVYDRKITKLVAGTFERLGTSIVTVNGSPVNLRLPTSPSSPLNRVTVGYATGVLTFDTAPAAGAIVALLPGGEFDVHCRFDTDQMEISQDFWETQSWSSIPLVEIKDR